MDDPSLAEQDRQVGLAGESFTSRRLLYFSQLFSVAGSANGAPLGMSVSKKNA